MNKTIEFLNNMLALSKVFFNRSSSQFNYEAFEIYVSERDRLIEEFKLLGKVDETVDSKELYKEIQILDHEIQLRAKNYLNELQQEIDTHKDNKHEQGKKMQQLRKMKKYFGTDKPVDPYYFDRKK